MRSKDSPPPQGRALCDRQRSGGKTGSPLAQPMLSTDDGKKPPKPAKDLEKIIEPWECFRQIQCHTTLEETFVRLSVVKGCLRNV